MTFSYIENNWITVKATMKRQNLRFRFCAVFLDLRPCALTKILYIFKVVSAEQNMVVIQCSKPEDSINQCEFNTSTTWRGCMFVTAIIIFYTDSIVIYFHLNMVTMLKVFCLCIYISNVHLKTNYTVYFCRFNQGKTAIRFY